jgi:hypothetical protein
MVVTAQDMYNAFLLELDKYNTHTVYPDEWEIIINKVQLDVIENRYSEVEEIQKRMDDLRILKTVSTIPNSGNDVSGEEKFDLPVDYLHVLNIALDIDYVNDKCCRTGKSGFRKAKPMKSDKKYEIADDPFNKPTNDRLYYDLIGKEILPITGTESFASDCRMEYLRYPRDIEIVNQQVDCELPVHIRQEIVDVAVRQVLEQFESQRYQTTLNENRLNIN